MTTIDLKKKIEASIQSFSTGNLLENSIDLFRTLGYSSERRVRIEPNTFAGFMELYPNLEGINQEKALTADWDSVDFLFQLTGEDIRRTSQEQFPFDESHVDDQIIESYLFLAIELTHQAYSRSKLADITREVNKAFAMPVMILFKNRELLTLSIINRRINKKDQSRDVLEKVTLIKGINIKSPNRAHVEILFDLSLPELERNRHPNNFIDLHKAWQDTLNISELNKKFYKEIVSWYFHAVENVKFPEGNIKDENFRNATNVIRLITRLVFVWFIKEKGLVPDVLFDDERLKEMLNFTDPQGSTYYKAILQNLFFATLNTEMGSARRFRGENQNPNGLDAHYGISTVYRYKEYFKDPNQGLSLFADIPFLNGGLFECLDKREENLLVDGFSKIPENQPVVPDSLFFGKELIVDLSKWYGDEQHTKEKVRPLINILKSYKFTIEENTPVEEEIALDPELLGRVFENLLAAYNPETGTTARKQTGSFYTPREIVNYMVDESLTAYLINSLQADEYQDSEKSLLESKLRHLMAYNEELPRFSEQEQDRLISAINKVKVLDPACGSGAFPMGVLHKLVFILNKIDPGNTKWKQRQIEEAVTISDSTARDRAVEAIEKIFIGNELDYGRKLYLIQNSIFGVDIQPIAVQIAKLRFFISLVVDQKVDRTKPNLNILALPNLESKFVAANTLLGIEQSQQPGLPNQLIVKKEAQLAKVRDSLFTARTHATKRKLREQDKRIRSEIAELLVSDGWANDVSSMLSSWDPFDQNASAGYFDAKWMFGIENGFDIVLGNPPYIQLQKDGGVLANLYADKGYETFNRTGDIYCLFYELGDKLLRESGHLCLITSNKWMRTGYGVQLRKFFAENTNPKLLLDFAGKKLFDNVTVDNNILLYQKNANTHTCKTLAVDEGFNVNSDFTDYINANLSISCNFVDSGSWVISSPIEDQIRKKIEALGTPLGEWDINIYYGIKTGFNEAFIIDGKTKDRLISEDPKSAEIIKPILRGRDIKRYRAEFADQWLIATFPVLNLNISKFSAVSRHLKEFGKRLEQVGEKYIDENGREIATRKKTGNKWFETQDQIAYYKEFEQQKIMYPNMTKYLPFFLDEGRYFSNDKTFLISGKLLSYLTAFLNSQLFKYVYREKFPELQGGTRELRKIFFDKLRIPRIDAVKEEIFHKLVTCMQLSYSAGLPNQEVDERVNTLIYDICELNQKEREIINAYQL